MSLNMLVVYEPRGKAREYSELAVNLYNGCGHRCVYCYAPASIHVTLDTFYTPKPRPNLIEKLDLDLEKLHLGHRPSPVLLCFTCDPYQPIDNEYQLARKAIQVLHSHNTDVMILTKGGRRAERDFDLLTSKDWFGVTLTNLDDTLSREWEPRAALPGERIEALRKAHENGVKTWVSLEPVLYPETTLDVIRQTHRFVDKFNVGTLNYHPHSKNIGWHEFAVNAKNLLTELECVYYLKEDLRKWL